MVLLLLLYEHDWGLEGASTSDPGIFAGLHLQEDELCHKKLRVDDSCSKPWA
jgi:hypothetical protein